MVYAAHCKHCAYFTIPLLDLDLYISYLSPPLQLLLYYALLCSRLGFFRLALKVLFHFAWVKRVNRRTKLMKIYRKHQRRGFIFFLVILDLGARLKSRFSVCGITWRVRFGCAKPKFFRKAAKWGLGPPFRSEKPSLQSKEIYSVWRWPVSGPRPNVTSVSW